MQYDQQPSDIEIQTPCPKSWDSLVGDERKRFCSECNLHVHNSAALTRTEAAELVRAAQGRLCMRIVRSEGGAPIYMSTEPTPLGAPSEGPVRPMPRLTGWLLAAGAGLFSACAGETPAVVQLDPSTSPNLIPEDPLGSGVPIIEILGEVACPDPADTLPPTVEMGWVAPDELVGGIDPLECAPVPDCDAVPSDGPGLGEDPPQVSHEMMGRIALPPRQAAPADTDCETESPNPDRQD